MEKIFAIEEKILRSGKTMTVVFMLAGLMALTILGVFLFMLTFRWPSWY